MFHPHGLLYFMYWFAVFHLFPFPFPIRVICCMLHPQSLVVGRILLPDHSKHFEHFRLYAYGTPVPLSKFEKPFIFGQIPLNEHNFVTTGSYELKFHTALDQNVL